MSSSLENVIVLLWETWLKVPWVGLSVGIVESSGDLRLGFVSDPQFFSRWYEDVK